MRKTVLWMLTALCLLLSAAGVSAEETAAGTPVQIGKASFLLPEDLMILYQDDTGLMGTGPDYDLWIMWYDWAELPQADLEAYTKGDVQTDHLYAMYLAQTGDARTAKQAADMAVAADIGMLDGDEVLHSQLGSVVVCSHYYRHSGFMVRLAPANAGDPAAWQAICDQIALSFRLEGVSEEQMAADQVKWAVVTADTARIRHEPDISAWELKLARKGDRFELVRQEGVWYVVKVDGRQGYIHSGVTEIRSGGQ